MPGQQQPEAVYVDEHHQRISEFAAEYLDDDERDEFVDGLMERRGYTRIQGWGPPEEPDDGGQGGGRRPAGQQRNGGQGQQGGQQRRGSYFKR